MSVTHDRLAQDLRLLDLLDAHPELKQPEAVDLRGRLTELCKTQEETVSDVLVAQTVLAYMSETSKNSAISTLMPWRRPATEDERKAALSLIEAGTVAEKSVFKNTVVALLVGALLGIVVGSVTGLSLLFMPISSTLLCALSYTFSRSRLSQLSSIIQKKKETVQKWAIEQPSKGQPLVPPSWNNDSSPGWELRKCSITPVGIRRFIKSPQAVAALRAIHDHPVTLLLSDFAHVERLAEEDKKLEEAQLRKEWEALLAQRPVTISAQEDDHE